MQKIVLTFGLIAGAILSAMLLVTASLMDGIGFDSGAVIGYTSMVLAFLLVFVGVKSYRDNVAGGRIGFGRALALGLMITAVASVCYVATWQLIVHRIAPDFVDRYAAYEIDKARKAGASEAQLADKVREMAEFQLMYQNPAVNVALTFLEPLPVGVLFSLISAGVLSRRRRVGVGVSPT
jgi:hypothetical protein